LKRVNILIEIVFVMKHIAVMIMIIIGMAFVAVSGCTSPGSSGEDIVQATETPSDITATTITPATTPFPVEPILSVTPKIYGVDFSLPDPILADMQNLEVLLHYNYRINYFDTDKGVKLYITFFAYNLDDVPVDFSPVTSDDVKSAGIPYKTRRDTMYFLNEKTITVTLPGESSQGTLDLLRPYNYGAIVEWTEN